MRVCGQRAVPHRDQISLIRFSCGGVVSRTKLLDSIEIAKHHYLSISIAPRLVHTHNQHDEQIQQTSLQNYKVVRESEKRNQIMCNYLTQNMNYTHIIRSNNWSKYFRGSFNWKSRLFFFLFFILSYVYLVIFQPIKIHAALNMIFFSPSTWMCSHDVIERFTIRSSSICVFVCLWCSIEQAVIHYICVFGWINSFAKWMIVGFCFVLFFHLLFQSAWLNAADDKIEVNWKWKWHAIIRHNAVSVQCQIFW